MIARRAIFLNTNICTNLSVNESIFYYIYKAKCRNKVDAKVVCEFQVSYVPLSDFSFLDPSKQFHCSNLLTLKVNIKIFKSKIYTK